MTYRLVKPLALAVGLALSINAMAAPAVFDVKELDTSIKPCADFNGFVNAQWVATHPIPADRTRWGSFDMLREDSLNVQHKIVDDVSRTGSHAAGGLDPAEDRLPLRLRHGRSHDRQGRLSIRSSQSSRIAAVKTPSNIVALYP
jgi:hypothetical protein